MNLRFQNRLQFWRRNEDLGSFALEHYEMYGDTAIKFVRASLEFDIFITVDVKASFIIKNSFYFSPPSKAFV